MTTLMKPAFLAEKPAKTSKVADAPPPTRASLVAAIAAADAAHAAKLPELQAKEKETRERHEQLHAETLAAKEAAVAASYAVYVAGCEARNAKERALRLLRETASPMIGELRAALIPIEESLRARSYSHNLDTAFERISLTDRGVAAPPLQVDAAPMILRAIAAARDELTLLEVSDLEGVALRNRLALIWRRVEVASGSGGE